MKITVVPRNLRLRLAAAMLLAAGLTLAEEQPNTRMTPEEIQAKVDWVNEAESGDFQFWRRWRDRPDAAAFRQPQTWYNPMILVEGGVSQPFFPAAAANEPATIDPAAIAAASGYAMERETQAFMVYHRGKIRHAAFMPGYHEASAISSHSWVKTLHGILAGFALADGDIESLDDPVEKYIHEWGGDARGRITVRQVLHNTTGLELPFGDFSQAPQPYSKGIQLVEGSDINATVLSFELAEEPGTSFAHNNPNTQLAGMILQRATGQNFARYLSEKLWRPMGGQGGAMRLDGFEGNVISYCCFLSAPADWMRVAHLLMNDGRLPDGARLLPEGWVDEMLAGSAANPNYGFQIWTDAVHMERRPYFPGLPPEFANHHSEPFAADDLFYLDGGGKVRVWISPGLDLIVLRMGYPPPPGKGFDEAFIPNTIIRGILGAADIPE